GAGHGQGRGLPDARPARRRLLRLARRIQLCAAQPARAARSCLRPAALPSAHGRNRPRPVTSTKPLGGEFDQFTDDPLWYKDAVIYELHVRAFYDSDGDGIGDFAGLTQKLDYLQELGVTALWLLPFYPSPGLDDGYDIADYTDVNPSYGTLKDFKTF